MKEKINPENEKQTVMRESGIELLKIVALSLIVIYHVVQTLSYGNPFLSYHDYVINLAIATNDVQQFVLTLLSYFGAWGNAIFFICSAWFLLQSKYFNKKKWFHILLEIWGVSVIILIISCFLLRGNISLTIVIKSLFPTLYGNNWYLTCYVLFYPIHPLLNKLIQSLSKPLLFRLSSAMFILYCCLGFIKSDLFFPSMILLWITIYFVIAYIQIYMTDFTNNMKKNIFLLIIGMIGYIGLAVLTNVLGLHFTFMKGRMLQWATNCNPFLIAMAIAMLNIARNVHFKNKFINYISGLSLLIYIIHENLVLRTYFRPYIINYVYVNFGYDKILIWVMLIAIAILIFGIVSSVVYDKTLRKFIRKISVLLYPIVRKIYLYFETAILKLH